MILTVAELRQRVAATVEALAAPSAWTQARVPYDSFPVLAGPGTPMTVLSFAVGIPETIMESAIESRRAGGSGAARSTVAVRWLYKLRADNAVLAYDEALAAEALMVAAVLATSAIGLHLTLANCTRAVVGDGEWFLGEARFETRHRIQT